MRRAAALVGLTLLFGCGGEAPAPGSVPEAGNDEAGASAETPPGDGSPNADRKLVASLREDLTTPRHVSDGGGRAWIEGPSQPSPLRVGRPGRVRIGFEAGPEGISEGGRILLQVPPYWGWSTPQVDAPERWGFTVVSTPAPGVSLVASTLDAQLLEVVVEGRALEPGETVHFDYGAGPAGARVDRFAERESPFVISVDGDGDGVRGFLAEWPKLDIAPGKPAQLVAVAPSVLRPGEEGVLRISLLDAWGNTGVEAADVVHIQWPAVIEGPAQASLDPESGGRVAVAFRVAEAAPPGVGRVSVAAGDWQAESNPVLVSTSMPHVLWGDLHGHSNLSDGTGTPEDFYRYARDVAGLDVAALTDHDHWGFPFLDAVPANWLRIQRAARDFHAPRRFVTLLGYEWTSWLYGHRHVLHFEDHAPLRSSIDERTDTPGELWAALRGAPALTFAHHSAGQPVATDWSVAPDPELEPLTEIASVHGSSESFDTPHPVRGMLAGNTVRDALDRGYRLGFIGSGDSHDGHPGIVLPTAPISGLAGILSEGRTREAVLAALRQRRSYATNGPRIVLDVRLGGSPMGALLQAQAPGVLDVRAVGAAALDAVEIVTPDGVERIDAAGELSVAFEGELEPLSPGEWLYVRVLQLDGGAAWSSPYFFE